MFYFILYSHFAVIILQLLLIGNLYKKPPSFEKELIQISLLCVMLEALSYAFELTAPNEEIIRICFIFGMAGKSFIGINIFMFYNRVYSLGIKKYILTLLETVHIIIFLLIVNYRSCHLFIKSTTIVQGSTIQYLTIQYGPVYYIYFTLNLIYFAFILYGSIHRLLENPSRQHKIICYLSLIFVSLPFIGKSLDILLPFKEYRFSDFALIFSQFVMYIIIVRFHLLDLISIGFSDIIKTLDDGIIMYDLDNNIVYHNDFISNLFDNPKNALTEYCNLTLSELLQKKSVERNINQMYFEITILPIVSNKKTAGYTVNFKNITKQKEYSQSLEHEVEFKEHQLNNIQENLMLSLANMIEKRDGLTGAHVQRTRDYVELISRKLYEIGKVDSDFLQKVYKAAPLHDIGKIAIPDTILNKPGKLTPEEFEIIKTHSAIGAELLEEIRYEGSDGSYLDSYLDFAYDMALYHHEKWNGTGYPNGCKGEMIPLSARIMAIADVFDALVSKRVYKEAFSYDKAFSIIEESSGTHFQPEIVDIFLANKEEIIAIAESYT